MSPRRLLSIAAALAALVAVPAISQTLAVPPNPAAAARRAGVGIVDWQAATVATRRAAANNQGLGGLNRVSIDSTRLPILLPGPDLIGGARLYSFGDYYSITADMPGVGVSLTGTTAVLPLPDKSPLRLTTEGPENLTIQRTVDGQLASFTRYGVLYTVEVRCDAPADVRCRNETLVRQLVASTNRVVMGQAARQAAGMGG